MEKLEKENLYDYISNNYWKMEKEHLAEIAKELIYASNDKAIGEAVDSYNERYELL